MKRQTEKFKENITKAEEVTEGGPSACSLPLARLALYEVFKVLLTELDRVPHTRSSASVLMRSTLPSG